MKLQAMISHFLHEVSLLFRVFRVGSGGFFPQYEKTPSLHRDFLPANWGQYAWSIWDTFILVGSFGMFFTIFLLYLRGFPAISIAEIKPVMRVGYDDDNGGHAGHKEGGH